MIARLGDRPGLGGSMAQALDQENINTVAAIRSKLKVAGKSKRGKSESATGNYPWPHRISGRLQLSIGSTSAIVELGNSARPVVRSAVGSGVGTGSSDVRYAKIHEFGGTINVPSRPTRSKGPYGIKHPVTAAYTVTIPERAYIRPTIKERAQRYTKRLSYNVVRFLRGGNN